MAIDAMTREGDVAPTDGIEKELASLVRGLTLFLAEVAFLSLVLSFVVRTFSAKAGVPPDLPDVQASAAGALAVALGGGYALTLGIPSADSIVGQSTVITVKKLFLEKVWLSLGVLLYLIAGVATCIAYGLNEAETPGVLKTIAVGFGGYVIAYIGVAYRQLNE
jgi:hypothetical protein